MKTHFYLQKTGIYIVLLFFMLHVAGCGSFAGSRPGEESAEPALHETEESVLEEKDHQTYEYDKDHPPAVGGLYSQYQRAARRYSEEEKAKFCHAYFDDQDRLLYVLGYSSAILGDRWSYCEENIYQWDDEARTCRYIYYKSNSKPYRDGYYIAARYMFESTDLQFDEEGRLCSSLTYRRNVGSDPNGYSEELFFDRGYRAEYQGNRLMEELQYYDYWGTNEVGSWEYAVYQYDEQGNCTQRVVVTEDGITLSRYVYHEEAGQMEEYTYQVTEDWELSCEDGSVYYFSPEWGETAVKKVAADGTVEKELFYGKAMDLGQQHYRMPEEVEETLDDHMYVVKPGDSLWTIAYERYGYGTYWDLLHRMNRNVVGWDADLIQPGMRLYLPETGNAEDTKIRE